MVRASRRAVRVPPQAAFLQQHLGLQQPVAAPGRHHAVGELPRRPCARAVPVAAEAVPGGIQQESGRAGDSCGTRPGHGKAGGAPGDWPVAEQFAVARSRPVRRFRAGPDGRRLRNRMQQRAKTGSEGQTEQAAVCMELRVRSGWTTSIKGASEVSNTSGTCMSVATPIGNRDDITRRAIEVLRKDSTDRRRRHASQSSLLEAPWYTSSPCWPA